MGIHHGGETEWDYLWQKAHETTVASQAEIMMRALAATQKTWLLWRYARWTLDASKVRMQDVSNVFNYYSHSPLGRSVASDFLLTNWDEINNRCVTNESIKPCAASHVVSSICDVNSNGCSTSCVVLIYRLVSDLDSTRS